MSADDLPRDGEVKVDCAKLCQLIAECGLTRAQAERKLENKVSHSVWHRMSGGPRERPLTSTIVQIGNANRVIDLAREILKRPETELTLSAILYDEVPREGVPEQTTSKVLLVNDADDHEFSRKHFIKCWKFASETISQKISSGQSWVFSIKNCLDKQNEIVPRVGYLSPIIEQSTIELVCYRSDIEAIVKKYNETIDQVDQAVIVFNYLIYPNSSDFHFYYKTLGLLKELDPTHDDTEDRAEAGRTAEHLRELLGKYGLSQDARMGVLFDKVEYRNDVQASRSKLSEITDKLDRTLSEMRKKVAYYDIAILES